MTCKALSRPYNTSINCIFNETQGFCVPRNSKFSTHENKSTASITKCIYSLNCSDTTQKSWLSASQLNCMWLNSFIHRTIGLTTSLWTALKSSKWLAWDISKTVYSIFHCDGSEKTTILLLGSIFKTFLQEKCFTISTLCRPAQLQVVEHGKYAYKLQNTVLFNFYF